MTLPWSRYSYGKIVPCFPNIEQNSRPLYCHPTDLLRLQADRLLDLLTTTKPKAARHRVARPVTAKREVRSRKGEALAGSHQAGALWECHVTSQWLRWRDWQQPAAGLWYWRDQPGNEVDLVIELDQRLIPIECKMAARPQAKSLRGIHAFRAMYEDHASTQAFIACTTTEPFDLEPGTTAVSGWTTWPLKD